MSGEATGAFDRALERFLAELAGAGEASWDVKVDGDQEWELALWLDGRYAGLWRITEQGSDLVDTTGVGAEVMPR